MYYPCVLHAVVCSTLIVSLGVHVQECYSSVCLSVKSHLTSGASICPENTLKILSRTQQATEVKKNCGVISATALLQNPVLTPLKAIELHTVSHFLQKAHVHYSVYHMVLPRVHSLHNIYYNIPYA